jgi:hypothetical protein
VDGVPKAKPVGRRCVCLFLCLVMFLCLTYVVVVLLLLISSNDRWWPAQTAWMTNDYKLSWSSLFYFLLVRNDAVSACSILCVLEGGRVEEAERELLWSTQYASAWRRHKDGDVGTIDRPAVESRRPRARGQQRAKHRST